MLIQRVRFVREYEFFIGGFKLEITVDIEGDNSR